MSLLEELALRGVAVEDLEKAASARLFQKVANEQGVDLTTLDKKQIEQLFADFEQNILPQILGNDTDTGEPDTDPKTAEEPVVDDPEKAASVLLFAKTAAAEGIDLDSMEEKEVDDLYQYFLTEMLPGMFAQEKEAQAQAKVELEKEAQVKQAEANLAEVSILGRHMAQAFNDELNKIAAANPESILAKVRGAEGEKKASAIDKLAHERAAEILKENGLEPDAVPGAKEPEPQTDPLDDVVNARAVELLKARGFTFAE